MTRSSTVTSLQKRAYGFYGLPGTENRAVGEVRYVVGWHADQMTRLDWDVFINGSDKWNVTLPAAEGETPAVISTLIDGQENQTEASSQLLELIDWTDTNIKAVDTNLFVGGAGDYAKFDGRWRVVSPIEAKRKELLETAQEQVPFLWPHPADPKKPDAPLFSVLELLDELDWLNRQSRTQSRQRAMIAGILGISEGFNPPDGGDFWDEWNTALSTKMRDADDLSPLRLSGPTELIKDGINWVIPNFGYDDVLDRRVNSAIQRLAYGLPIPPEILLGMQAQSRATAFQVEENAYRAHIEPPAMMVAQVAQDALASLLDGFTVEVVPNPSRLLARRNSVQDVKDAYDRGLVTTEYVREVLGIPEDAAPDPEKDGIPPAGVGKPPTDPANVAADAPVTAAASEQDLSELLATIDKHLSSELAGATVMAVDRARQRLGAAARSNDMIRGRVELKNLTSSQLATKLGYDGLLAAGVDVADRIAEPVDAASRWWVRRVGQAWEQAATLIPGWAGQGDWVTESVNALAEALALHIVQTLETDEPSPLSAGDIRTVVDVAAGGQPQLRVA